MKFNLKLYCLFFLLIFASFYSCKPESDKTQVSLIGNWYFSESNFNGEQDETNYIEVYFSKDKLFTYDDMVGLVQEYDYKISKDSLYLGFDEKLKYDSKLINPTKKLFKLIYSNSDTISFFKIDNGLTIEEKMRDSHPLIRYKASFHSRKNIIIGSSGD
ncbi:MAG: hypothetical protein ACI863_001007 [Flavobacteriales bacterium]|jgi:hypothetical protein